MFVSKGSTEEEGWTGGNASERTLLASGRFYLWPRTFEHNPFRTCQKRATFSFVPVSLPFSRTSHQCEYRRVRARFLPIQFTISRLRISLRIPSYFISLTRHSVQRLVTATCPQAVLRQATKGTRYRSVLRSTLDKLISTV
jgi:hypothetical protein